MAIINGKTSTPKATTLPKAGMYQLPPKPRTTGGISGPGGSNVSQDYKETGDKKNFWQKIQKTFRTIPAESPEVTKYNRKIWNN